jgi:DNA-binding LacI/PurR family transcriptional regulator
VLFEEGDFTCDSGYVAMQRILAANARPTAVIAGNDTLAIGAMVAVREAGFSIPQEFAVVGYDDIPAAAFTCPPLTTVRSHAFEQGKIAGDAAIALVNGKGVGRQSAVVPLELVVRDYTRGVRAVHKTEHLSAVLGSITPVTPELQQQAV